MPISLNAIRDFTGDGRFVLGQQGQVEEIGKFQRFKVFFNIGDARKQNGDTLLAIHHAILNDPRYFSPDVQKRAAELLSQVRSDRALGKAQIKSIITELDAMTGEDQLRSAGRKLFVARFAERGFPDFLPQEAQDMIDQWLPLYRDELLEMWKARKLKELPPLTRSVLN